VIMCTSGARHGDVLIRQPDGHTAPQPPPPSLLCWWPNSTTPTSSKLPRAGKFRGSRHSGIWTWTHTEKCRPAIWRSSDAHNRWTMSERRKSSLTCFVNDDRLVVCAAGRHRKTGERRAARWTGQLDNPCISNNIAVKQIPWFSLDPIHTADADATQMSS